MSDAFPILSAGRLPEVRAFYERLGFRPTYQFPPDTDAPDFVVLERDGVQLGLGRGEGGDGGRFAYWVYVDDVDATVEALRAARAEVVAEPVDQPWGERVASVRDPGGTLVHLGQAAAPTSSSGPTP